MLTPRWYQKLLVFCPALHPVEGGSGGSAALKLKHVQLVDSAHPPPDIRSFARAEFPGDEILVLR